MPLRFVRKVEDNPVFGSFFNCKLRFEVGKESFFPVPRTNSAVVELIHLPDAIENKNLGLFLRQYMYQHEDQLVKNSLMEGIIRFAKDAHGKKMTKNEARKIVAEAGISEEGLNTTPGTKELYNEVGKKFRDVKN